MLLLPEISGRPGRSKSQTRYLMVPIVKNRFPLINELESAMHQMYQTVELPRPQFQRRQEDIKDESSGVFDPIQVTVHLEGFYYSIKQPPDHGKAVNGTESWNSFGRDRASKQEHAKQTEDSRGDKPER
ncbi:unnamed protein product [Ranitomeya imitator]|uniref:Uncharacterized protein n=1 Tax=Ranitomeya imitator TaxID=111125 RepID=A0ABN9M9X1_9NEOB|nr:unnamed protein product [Ranitomeya imitator]